MACHALSADICCGFNACLVSQEMAVTQKEASCLAQACNAGALGFAEGIAEWIDSKTDGITECSDDFKPATEGGVLHTPHLVLA